jgi:hypothetical protein
MSSFVWSPDPAAHRRQRNTRKLFDEDDENKSPRRPRRTFPKLAWSREQIILGLAFTAALMFGYVASTLLWQLEGFSAHSLTFDVRVLQCSSMMGTFLVVLCSSVITIIPAVYIFQPR